MLTLPGDLPLLTVADVQAIITPPDPRVPVVLVPNRDDLGTNAIVLSPPDCLPWPLVMTAFSVICAWRLSVTWRSKSAVSHVSLWTSTNQAIWRCLRHSRCRAIVSRC